MHITIIAGARPNFIKISPIIRAFLKAKKEGKRIDYRLVHTGQHYDKKLSGNFFEDLQIPEPHANLEVGSGSQAEQTAKIMVAFEKDLQAHPSDVVLVVGDVNSTMACAIVAKKLNTKVVHVEAGIRSFDLSMPEEINRMVTDALADHFFTTSTIANQNLLKEGISDYRIHFVGNTMIDTLLYNLKNLKQPDIWNSLNLHDKSFIVLTLHRPSNVDEAHKLGELLKEIIESSNNMPVVFPVHPRTRKMLNQLNHSFDSLILLEPLGYLDFIYLIKQAKGVVTDSGGIQEETTVLGVPCITLRDNTERPETVEVGTNELIGTNPKAIKPAFEKLLTGAWKKGRIPELWDGKTAERIVDVLLEIKE